MPTQKTALEAGRDYRGIAADFLERFEDAVVVLDGDLRCVYGNIAACAWLGEPASAFIGKPLLSACGTAGGGTLKGNFEMQWARNVPPGSNIVIPGLRNAMRWTCKRRPMTVC